MHRQGFFDAGQVDSPRMMHFEIKLRINYCNSNCQLSIKHNPILNSDLTVSKVQGLSLNSAVKVPQRMLKKDPLEVETFTCLGKLNTIRFVVPFEDLTRFGSMVHNNIKREN